MIRIETTITVDLGNGKTAAFTGHREGGGDNPRYYSHEGWERGGALLTELIADVERQCGELPEGVTRTPSEFTKPAPPPYYTGWQGNNFRREWQWEVGDWVQMPPGGHGCRQVGDEVLDGLHEMCCLTTHGPEREHVFAFQDKVTRVATTP